MSRTRKLKRESEALLYFCGLRHSTSPFNGVTVTAGTVTLRLRSQDPSPKLILLVAWSRWTQSAPTEAYHMCVVVGRVWTIPQ